MVIDSSWPSVLEKNPVDSMMDCLSAREWMALWVISKHNLVRFKVFDSAKLLCPLESNNPPCYYTYVLARVEKPFGDLENGILDNIASPTPVDKAFMKE